MASKTSSLIGSPNKKSQLSRENYRFIYSLILIFLIPAAIIINIFWTIQKNQKIIQIELKNKAVLAETIFSGGIAHCLDNDNSIQSHIDNIFQTPTELTEITVLKPSEDGFLAVASSDSSVKDATYKSLQYTTAWVENKKIISISMDEQSSQRNLILITPLKNSDSNTIALVNAKISLGEIDALTQKTLIDILIMLAITVFLVLLLLFNHFQFFEYVILAKRLKEVDKMKDDFISMASHELKAPMAAIKGYMAMIFEGVSGKVDKKAKMHLEKISANIKRLDGLINALLDVSRLEQGRMQFDMEAVDISHIINDIIAQIKVQADQKNIKIIYQDLPKPHPFIFADPERLAQIFDNVINNAIKYTKVGKITISHRLEDDCLNTFIEDTGMGMAAEDIKGLFGKFYRIRNEKTADIPGTGLGLWITKEIISKMDGHIYVQSQVDVGTTFTIVFPIIKESQK